MSDARHIPDGTTLGAADPLGHEIDLRLARFRAQLGPHLGAAFDELAARLGFAESGPRVYFFHPLALPIVQLPAWVASAARAGHDEISPAVVADLAESAAAGYLHVRLQDDLLDEGEGRPGATMLLAEALLVHHHTLLARAVPPSARFWRVYEERWLAYGEAMLLERALFDGAHPYGAAEFERVLDRSRPLVLPGAAALAVSGDESALPELERFIDVLVRTHQLHVDLLDVEKDVRNGNPTWLVRRFAGEQPVDSGALRRRLFLEGGFDEVVGEIRAGLAEARSLAAALGLGDALPFINAREERITQAQQRAFAMLFAQILGIVG